MTNFLKTQWFTLAMGVLFGIAWLAPGLAKILGTGGWAKSGAIILVFFLSGLNLRTKEALQGLANWRLHVYIQGFSFIVLPLVCYLVLLPCRQQLPEGLVMGFYLLAVVPTTITSCAVLTQLAGGSFAGALFNAVLGNVLGIFVSPALFLLMIGSSDMTIELDAVKVFIKLGKLVLAPLIVGQIARQIAPEKAKLLRKTSSLVNRLCILLIVFFAFGQLFTGGLAGHSAKALLPPIALLIPAHLGLLWIIWAGAKLARFTDRDRVAILFSAPQKTLALSLPLVAAALAERPDLAGLASLPIIVYHPLQLVVAGLLVERVKIKEPDQP